MNDTGPKQTSFVTTLFSALTTEKAILIIISILGIIVFFNTFFNNFIGDDFNQIVDNPIVHSIGNFPRFFLGSTFNTGGQLGGVYYRPFQSAYYAVVYSLFGAHAFYFHLFQLLLHIVNAILLLLFFRYFFDKKLSFVLSLIFLVHPINTETISYIADAQDILFLLFGLLALNVVKKDSQSARKYFWIFLLLFSSLLSKETGLLFIPTLLFFVYLFKRKQLATYFGVSALVFLSYIFFRFGIAHIEFGMIFTAPFPYMSLAQRMINMPAIAFYYLKTAFYPMKLITPQSWFITSVSIKDFYGPLIFVSLFFIICVAIGLILFKKRRQWFRAYLFFSLLLVLGLVMHLQFFPLDFTVADRWFYFPLIGLLGVLGVCFANLDGFFRDHKIPVLLFVIVILGFFSVRSFIRTANWRDGLTLFSHDVKISRDNYVLEDALGSQLSTVGRYDEAKLHLEKSISLFPNGSNWTNLSVVYNRSGQNSEAQEALKKAIGFDDFYLAYENLAGMMFIYDEPLKAKEFINGALAKYPYSARIWLALALVENKLGDHEAALTAAEKSYSLGQDDLNTYVYTQLMNNKPVDVNLK